MINFIKNKKAFISLIFVYLLVTLMLFPALTPLTVKAEEKITSLSAKLSADSEKATVIVTSEVGFEENTVISVTDEEIKMTSALNGAMLDDEKIALTYTVQMRVNGYSVNPNQKFVVKMLIPEIVKEEEFRIINVYTQKVTKADAVEYTVDGDYAVFETENLSQFVFVYESHASTIWLWVLIGGLIVVFAVVGVFMYKRGK